MQIRLLFATPDPPSLQLFTSLLQSALDLTPLDVEAAHVPTTSALFERVEAAADDVILVDWDLSHEGTPDLVRELVRRNPRLRIVALLPLSYRQYRREVWQAGACSSIAKENMEQEWLSSVLCIMHRAMEREARLLAAFAAGQSVPASPHHACCAVPAPAGAAVQPRLAQPED